MKYLLCLLGLACATVFAREENGDYERRREEPRVILYEHADYRGDSLVLYPGEAIENFSGRTFEHGNRLNDSISSIRVEGGAEVYVYTEARFRGPVMRLTENVRDLSGRLLAFDSRDSWNDRISSLRIEKTPRRQGREREIDYDGVIRRAYRDLLARDPDDDGFRHYRSLMVDQGWTERMVREHIQHAEEFRREGAERIVRRAYQDILGREADPSGLKHYREMVVDRNWTEGDVRDDMRRSAEFRNKHGGH